MFVLALENTNDKPQAGKDLTLRIPEDSELLQGEVPAMDADGDKLSYKLLSNRNLPAGFVISADGMWSLDTTSAEYQPMAQGQERSYTAGIEVTDPYGGKVNTKINVVLVGKNDAPTITSLEEQTLTEGDKPLKGKLTAQDIDKGARLSWSLMSNKIPAGFSLSRQGVFTFDPRVGDYNGLAEGDYRTLVVVTKVSDEHGASANMPVQFTLAGSNDAPVANHKQVADLTLTSDNGFSAKLPSNLFTDPEGKELTLSVAAAKGGFATEAMPEWLTFNGSHFIADASALTESQTVRVQVTATDPQGDSVSSKLNVLVTVK